MAIEWEYLGRQGLPPGALFPKQVEMWRTPVPGGWLVLTVETQQSDSLSTTFYPDPEHEWDGSSLPREE